MKVGSILLNDKREAKLIEVADLGVVCQRNMTWCRLEQLISMHVVTQYQLETSDCSSIT